MAQFYLTHQNQFTTADPGSSGVNIDGSYSMSGYAVESNKFAPGSDPPVLETEEAFIAYTQTQIEDKLDDYLTTGAGTELETPSTFTGYLLVDAEWPRNMRWMGNLLDPDHGDYDEQRFDDLAAGFKLRGDVVRARFPNTKLGWYGPVWTNGKGTLSTPPPSDNLQYWSETGYLKLIDDGVFDMMDFITPILYIRFGSTDSFYDLIDDYTDAVLDFAVNTMATRAGNNFEVFPYLTPLIYNGGSNHNNEQPPNATTPGYTDLQMQIDKIEALGIAGFTMWHDNGGACCTFDAGSGDLTLEDYMTNLSFTGLTGPMGPRSARLRKVGP